MFVMNMCSIMMSNESLSVLIIARPGSLSGMQNRLFILNCGTWHFLVQLEFFEFSEGKSKQTNYWVMERDDIPAILFVENRL